MLQSSVVFALRRIHRAEVAMAIGEQVWIRFPREDVFEQSNRARPVSSRLVPGGEIALLKIDQTCGSCLTRQLQGTFVRVARLLVAVENPERYSLRVETLHETTQIPAALLNFR